MVDTAAGVYDRPSDQEEEINEAFYSWTATVNEPLHKQLSLVITGPGSHGGLQPP